MEQNLNNYHSFFQKNDFSKQPYVVVTLTNVRGSAPQNPGAKMIVSQSGLEWGTIGGGKVEKKCLDLCQEYLGKNLCETHKWNLQKDVGMTCGGEVEFLFEAYAPSEVWPIVIFGAGHVSQELTRVLLRLNCQIEVIDTRNEWLEKLPQDKKLTITQSESLKDEVQRLPDNCFVMTMTQGHATDLPILVEILKKGFPYVGAIGSTAKSIILKDELQKKGIDTANLICPIGEKIGTNSPSEIAISICAQLLKYRS